MTIDYITLLVRSRRNDLENISITYTSTCTLYTHNNLSWIILIVDTCSAYQKLKNIESDNVFLELAVTVHSFQWPIRDLEKSVS